ncbi:MAG: hypothetical protein H0V81_16650 [Solirubrobacterales bacterium]|nr:hypothetical protein [Solirubrobacterales bacterium]
MLRLVDHGLPLAFTFTNLVAFHGPGSPGGVAHAFKVLERALPLLAPGGPPERRELRITTPFGGPGARDGFELVTRAVSDGRYVVDPALARPELGATRERFVFALAYRDRAVTLALRDGLVTEEFVALLREKRDARQEARLTVLKQELCDRLMARRAAEVYDVTD